MTTEQVPETVRQHCHRCGDPLSDAGVVIRNTPGFCAECGLEIEAKDLEERFPMGHVIDSRQPPLPEPIVIDLIAEGKAIALVLASLAELPEYSIERVLKAVNDLLTPPDAKEEFYKSLGGSVRTYKVYESPMAIKVRENLERAGQIFGRGADDDDPVP